MCKPGDTGSRLEYKEHVKDESCLIAPNYQEIPKSHGESQLKMKSRGAPATSRQNYSFPKTLEEFGYRFVG